MAGFTSPSILFISTWDAPERAYLGELLPKLKAAGYTDYHEPSVGGFAMPLVAADAGYSPAQMTTSDVHLFTSILGELAAGNDMASLGVQIDGEPVDYLSTKPLEQAAQLIWLQMRMRIEAKPDTHYWITMLEDLWNNREAHLDEFRAQLERLDELVSSVQSQTDVVGVARQDQFVEFSKALVQYGQVMDIKNMAAVIDKLTQVALREMSDLAVDDQDDPDDD